MKTLNVHEAKTNLSAVLGEIEATQAGFTLCRNGKPVADLVPHNRRSRLTPDPLLSRVKIHSDLTDPIAEGDWEDA